ncbi:hypothetical protein AGMMS49545_16020 [Betaproteobacteria bacterium]|nr:hypothetical protein AGMMS49545_16020 [Betaproteobacteria bacterium]GHU47670.1 hypothetical protein AGMMS50289_23200 [Betaproteobacteria bacterium]
MAIITRVVGKNGNASRSEVEFIQGFLNQWLRANNKKTLMVDGDAGKNTKDAIVWFQSEIMHMMEPDGRVSPDNSTLNALISLPGHPSPAISTSLPSPVAEGKREFSTEKIEWAARELGVEVAHIRAVAEVETNNGIFLNPKSNNFRLKILFERHKFYQYADKKFNYHRDFPKISNPSASSTGGYGGEAYQYVRLEVAMLLDRDAALKSTSWTAFQLMGENYTKCGEYAGVQGFVNAMHESVEGTSKNLSSSGFVKITLF